MALAIGLFSHPYETYQKSANFADPKQINLGRSRVLGSQGDTTGEQHTWPRSSVDKHTFRVNDPIQRCLEVADKRAAAIVAPTPAFR